MFRARRISIKRRTLSEVSALISLPHGLSSEGLTGWQPGRKGKLRRLVNRLSSFATFLTARHCRHAPRSPLDVHRRSIQSPQLMTAVFNHGRARAVGLNLT
jgi:hypothetical protein